MPSGKRCGKTSRWSSGPGNGVENHARGAENCAANGVETTSDAERVWKNKPVVRKMVRKAVWKDDAAFGKNAVENYKELVSSKV